MYSCESSRSDLDLPASAPMKVEPDCTLCVKMLPIIQSMYVFARKIHGGDDQLYISIHCLAPHPILYCIQF